MGLPAYQLPDYIQSEEQVREDKAVTPLTNKDKLLIVSDLLLNLGKVRKGKINPFAGLSSPVSYRTLFKILNAIERLKPASKTKVSKMSGCNLNSTCDSIDWLLANGYLSTYKRAIRVECFNAYRKITCYCLTVKGRSILYETLAKLIA